MVADGYAVLLGHIKRIFESTNGLTWIEPVAVYAKPTNNMPQTPERDHAAFVLQLFVYVPRPRVQRLTPNVPPTRYRARIQKQLPRVAEYMRERQIEGGAATTRYAAVSQA
ncbi:hypothetical protein JG687_00017122 [Phytophthora cactorum]|uniref:Uncharacterized protein n=1 Tax=Phytophthora cactorum TaxID=29920 RepID=A0A8T1TTA5_9STRA|nr:hypothetical protein JG687_00017122 [Phytophthora cactorum]